MPNNPKDNLVDREFLDVPLDLSAPAISWSGISSVNKFGRTTNADNDVPTDVWDGANATDDEDTWLPPLNGAVTHEIVSTSADDTFLGTSGAKGIQIYGIGDWDNKEISETISMSGTTPVTTTNVYSVIHRMKVISTGVNATSANAGVITATANDLANKVTAQINIGEGQTQMAIYGISGAQDFYLTKLYATVLRANLSTNEAHVDVNLLFNPSGNVTVGGMWLVKHSSSCGTRAASLQHLFKPYNKFSGPGILKIQVTGSANNLDVSAGFDGILVDK